MAQRYQATDIVTAVQWTGEVTAELSAFLGNQRYVVNRATGRPVLEVSLTAVVDAPWAEAEGGDWVLKNRDGEIFDIMCAADFAVWYAPARQPIELSFQLPTNIVQEAEGSCTVTIRPPTTAFASLGEILPQFIGNCDLATLDIMAQAISDARARARGPDAETLADLVAKARTSA